MLNLNSSSTFFLIFYCLTVCHILAISLDVSSSSLIFASSVSNLVLHSFDEIFPPIAFCKHFYQFCLLLLLLFQISLSSF